MPNGTGCLTDARWSSLLDLGKRLVWSVRVDNQRGKAPKDSGLVEFQHIVRYLLRWMGGAGYAAFSELDTAAAQEFAEFLLDDKGSSGEAEVGWQVVGRHLDVLCRIYEQAPALESHPTAVMHSHPFGGRSAEDVAVDFVARKRGFIPPVPDEVFLPVMTAALEWLEAPARDVARLSTEYQRVSANLSRKSNSYSWHLNKVLADFEFDDGGALTTPWRQRLTAETGTERWSASRGPTSLSSPIRRFRRLVQDVRDACTIVLQGMLGLRISEVAGLKVGPTALGQPWPGCVELRSSRTGLSEVFYLHGRLFKQRDVWEEVEWVAGSRPAGSDVLPPPVLAVMVLRDLYAPWRDQMGDDLVISLGRHQGLPGPGEKTSNILSDLLREGQKEFMDEHVVLPAGYEDWNLTTHQWRKSFALYVVRSDERLLPAVSEHFKHMSIAMTEQGYLGNDPELLGVMEDVATREAARLLFEAVSGKVVVAGKMADVIADNAESIRSMIGPEGSDEERIARFAESLKDDDIRIWPAPWGKCVFRSETARCHHQAKGEFDLGARRPNYAYRQAGTCCDCSNLLVLSDAHAPFWRERHAENVRARETSRQAGDDVAAAVAGERVRTSEAILRRMELVANLMEGGRDA